MFEQEKIMFTGGSGLLGSELKKMFPASYFPSHSEFDTTDLEQMHRYISGKTEIEAVFHAAAFTSPPKIDKEPIKALDNNIIGTGNLVKICSRHGLFLIYMSTDYVFKGNKGLYTEEDDLNPVNKYALSKLGGECAVRLYDDSLIIRTSFGPDRFPYEKAFIDQYTSRETVSKIAKKIYLLLSSKKTIRGIIHLGGARMSVYEYAASLDSSRHIGRLSINDVPFSIPQDTSLCCDKYDDIIKSG